MQKKSVLICDREEEICSICKLILDDEYQVETCNTYETLFDNLERARPDVIVVDFWMGDAKGEVAAKVLLESERTRDIPVILFSTCHDIDYTCRRVNAHDYIRKPFDIHTLRETVRKNLQ